MTNPTPHDRVDVLVIGSGLGGAIASKTLAEAGLSVVCLEQGSWWQPDTKPHYSPDWEWQRLTAGNTAPNIRRLHRITRSTPATRTR